MSGAARFPKDWQLEEFPPLALHEARKCDAVLAVQAPNDVRVPRQDLPHTS